jgi:hypothetical protein
MRPVKRGMHTKHDIISASEIGQYVYCSKSWYLQKCGYQPQSPRLEEGIQHHVTLGDTIDSMHHKTTVSWRLALLGLILLLLALLSIFYEVIL